MTGDWHVKERKVWKTKSSSKERTESREQRVETRTRKNREKITRFGSVKSVNCELY